MLLKVFQKRLQLPDTGIRLHYRESFLQLLGLRLPAPLLFCFSIRSASTR